MASGQKSPKELVEHLKALIDGTYTPPMRSPVDPESVDLFGGLAGVRLEGSEIYQIAPGLELRGTYAHVFSYYMGAFARPTKPNQPHPAPWQALKGGGIAFDVETEAFLCQDARLGPMSRLGSLWLLAALIRLLSAAAIHMPSISTNAYARIPEGGDDDTIWAAEIQAPAGRWEVNIDANFVRGLQSCLGNAAQLTSEPAFYRAFQTFDGAAWLPTPATQMIAIWTAIETVMRPGRQQITKRLASALGDYLGADRSARDRICNQAIQLYHSRGNATHDGQQTTQKALRESYMLARDMFIQIIATGQMPPVSP